MAIPISNASSRPLNANTGTLPDVGDALLDWFQPMTFIKIVKTVVGHQNKETPTAVDFRGVLQPLSGRELSMKPEGERSWDWRWVHADPSLVLRPDEIVEYLGTRFRVIGQKDYRLYGYVAYEIVNDYTGAGP